MPMPARRTSVRLRDGARIVLRSIRPEDKPLVLDAFERLSDESRYRRFFTPMQRLEPSLLAYLTEVDHHDHEAIVALDPRTGAAVGFARYVRLEAEPEAAEAAVTVVDDWQGRGVGHARLGRLVTRARREGIERFTAEVRAENSAAVELLTSLGSSELTRAGTEFHLVIELPARGVPVRLRRALRAAAAGWVSAADEMTHRLTHGRTTGPR
jgi:GNAT superfamily N-acetyltransferase